jgi:hypothetical protein
LPTKGNDSFVGVHHACAPLLESGPSGSVSTKIAGDTNLSVFPKGVYPIRKNAMIQYLLRVISIKLRKLVNFPLRAELYLNQKSFHLGMAKSSGENFFLGGLTTYSSGQNLASAVKAKLKLILKYWNLL